MIKGEWTDDAQTASTGLSRGKRNRPEHAPAPGAGVRVAAAVPDMVTVTIGQLAALAVQGVLKLLRQDPGPDPKISADGIAAVIRQNPNIIGVGNAYTSTTNVYLTTGRTARIDDDETIMLVARLVMELLSQAGGTGSAPARTGTPVLAHPRNPAGPETASVPDSPAVTAPIAASSLASGHMETFVLADERTLRHRWYWPNPNWSSWRDMPLPPGPVTAVAAGSKDEYHQEVAVVVRETVHHRWWTGKGDGWSGWHAMPALDIPVTDLAFSSNIADALEIYALDKWGRVRHRWWWRDAGWSDGWHPMDTPRGLPVTAIAAGSYADYHQELFAVVDGEIWHRWWWRNDGWSDWYQQAPAGMRVTDISVSSLKEGHIEIFALNGSGRMRHRWYWAGHGWSGWEEFPTPLGSRLTAITAVSGSARHQEVFGLKTSGRVTHAWNWLKDDGKPDWESWSEWSAWHYTDVS